MKKLGFNDSPSFFSGRCSKCSEVYQASSKSDDLEGISFQCKKVGCDGRVSLAFTPDRVFQSSKTDSTKPQRVC